MLPLEKKRLKQLADTNGFVAFYKKGLTKHLAICEPCPGGIAVFHREFKCAVKQLSNGKNMP